MYRTIKAQSSKLRAGDLMEGETLEQKLERVVNNGEAITDGAPEIFTERKDGVLPEYNPRTDKWDLATDAMDKVAMAKIAKRGNVVKMEPKRDGGAESIQGDI